ncbi:hypothetical protein NKI94_19260 [Mesorhizobium australicum]|uniref:hypothetical protein n=1 Tax=Mesorhizobium australicum TaxID=536018 RepID=UPI00333714E8
MVSSTRSYQEFDARKTYGVGDKAVHSGVLREAIPKPGTGGKKLLWRKVKADPARSVVGYSTRELSPGR